MEASEIPPEARLTDFLPLILEAGRQPLSPENWAVLYMEFALFAIRNPAAQLKLAEIDEANIAAVAELLSEEKTGLKGAELKKAARIIEALFRGISIMRSLDPNAVDEAFLESALSFVSRALTLEA